ncbi:hypothetical protein ABZW10_36565 [Kitasatospora sp. NPDC004723]|uniref:hypothetical protein n=1 Tax=Kitasatospora sp. NPDC004723 TaxID=3154288 RepID=UPI0033B254B0
MTRQRTFSDPTGVKATTNSLKLTLELASKLERVGILLAEADLSAAELRRLGYHSRSEVFRKFDDLIDLEMPEVRPQLERLVLAGLGSDAQAEEAGDGEAGRRRAALKAEVRTLVDGLPPLVAKVIRDAEERLLLPCEGCGERRIARMTERGGRPRKTCSARCRARVSRARRRSAQ